jgi:hypothetical protein
MSSVQSEGQRKPAIVILDFGSQYSELIARRVRETEVFSVVLGYSSSDLGSGHPGAGGLLRHAVDGSAARWSGGGGHG